MRGGGGGTTGRNPGATSRHRALGLRSGHVEVRVVKARVVEVRVRGRAVACGVGYVQPGGEERAECSASRSLSVGRHAQRG